MDEYRENIISMINTIENVDLLEYLEEYINKKIALISAIFYV